MKFIIRTTLRIIILTLLFTVPIGLFITALMLAGRDVPLWNIGIRNILIVSKNLLVPIVSASYLFSTLFAVALVDRMKIRSIVLLHIPPLVAGALIAAVLAFTGLIDIFDTSGAIDRNTAVGYRTFLKKDVFNRADGSMIRVSGDVPARSSLLLYEKGSNTLIPMNNISLSKSVKIDRAKRLLLISYEGETIRYSKGFPFSVFVKKSPLTSGRLVGFYTKHMRLLLRTVRSQYINLTGRDRMLFGGFLFLSVLLFSISLTNAMNARGWRLFGIVAVFLILFLLPLFYRAIFRIIDTAGGNPEFLGRYSYLFPAITAGVCGIIIDILAKVFGPGRAPSEYGKF